MIKKILLISKMNMLTRMKFVRKIYDIKKHNYVDINENTRIYVTDRSGWSSPGKTMGYIEISIEHCGLVQKRIYNYIKGYVSTFTDVRRLKEYIDYDSDILPKTVMEDIKNWARV